MALVDVLFSGEDILITGNGWEGAQWALGLRSALVSLLSPTRNAEVVYGASVVAGLGRREKKGGALQVGRTYLRVHCGDGL